MDHSVKIVEIADVTHNVRRYTPREALPAIRLSPARRPMCRSMKKAGAPRSTRSPSRRSTMRKISNSPSRAISTPAADGVTEERLLWLHARASTWSSAMSGAPSPTRDRAYFVADGAGRHAFHCDPPRPPSPPQTLKGHHAHRLEQARMADIILRDEFERLARSRHPLDCHRRPAGASCLHERIDGGIPQGATCPVFAAELLPTAAPAPMVKELRGTLKDARGPTSRMSRWEK